MSQLAEQFITAADYLVLERQAETKSEYLNGCIYAMSGASRSHNRITVNLTSALHAQLKRKPCEPFSGDMRVKVSPTGLYTYPDLVVVCGKEQFEDTHLDTLLNPTLIIEVLSDSTEAYDRGRKFEHYRHLDSLIEYVLIAQHRPHVESYRRQPDHQWLLTECHGLEGTLRLQSIDCDLALAEVYDKVELGENSLD